MLTARPSGAAHRAALGVDERAVWFAWHSYKHALPRDTLPTYVDCLRVAEHKYGCCIDAVVICSNRAAITFHTRSQAVARIADRTAS